MTGFFHISVPVAAEEILKKCYAKTEAPTAAGTDYLDTGIESPKASRRGMGRGTLWGRRVPSPSD